MTSLFSFYRTLSGSIVFVALFFFSLKVAGQHNPSKIHLVIDSLGVYNRVETGPDLPVRFSAPQALINSGERINAISLTATSTGSTCNLPNGTVVAVAAGGTAPYKYRLDGGSYYNTGNFPVVSPGNHVVEVKDATGAIASQNVVVNNTYSSPTLVISNVVRQTGCTTQDAIITLTASGGTPPYLYSRNMVDYQTSNIFTGLCYGDYIFYVKDANGCVGVVGTFTVLNQLTPINCQSSIGVSYTVFACTNEGNIRATGHGPNQPYTYSLDGINYQSSQDFTNLTSGYYPIYYRDALGNTIIFSVTIIQSCTVQLEHVTAAAGCGQQNGMLTVTANFGTPPYQYTIDGINYQPGNTFTNLYAGDYYVIVKDALNESHWTIATVPDNCPELSLTFTPAGCAGNDGTITASADNGTPPFSYSKDGVNFQASNLFTGLAPGSYTITLKDALGFTITETIIIPFNCVQVTGTLINASCGNNNGRITVTASNGTPPYIYSLDGINYQANNVFPNLAPGAYTVYAKDFASLIGTQTFLIINIPGPQISTLFSPAFCSNNNGSITVSGTGGTAPFEYSLTGNTFQAAPVFTGLAAGSYTAYIRDANGCLSTLGVLVPLNCPAIAAILSHETCNSGNGSITVSGSAGTSPYLFSIDGINYQAAGLFSGLTAGNYTIHIKDALGAVNNSTVSLLNVCPVVTAVGTNGYCGTANASVTATGTNGLPPYQFSIDGINFSSQTIFSNLASGTYTITVKDAAGLTNSTQVAVTNFPGANVFALSTPAGCLNNTGTISITGSGGTPPLQYSIDGTNFGSASTFSQLSSGNYTAFIRDMNNCTTSIPVIIPVQNDLTLTTDPPGSVTVCEGKSVVLPAVSNGSTFTWTPLNGLNNPGVQNPLAAPQATTKYYVTAGLGVCTQRDSVLVTVLPAPVAGAGPGGSICFGKDFVLSGTGGVDYQWSPSIYLNNAGISQPVVVKPPQNITYHLQVTDAAGCKSLNDAVVTIQVTPPVRIFAGNDTAVIMNQPYQLLAADVNNSGIVSYAWSPVSGLSNPTIPNPVVVLTNNSLYTVTGTTADGCEGSDQVFLKVFKGPEIYVPTAFTPNNDGKNDQLRFVPVGIRQFGYFAVYSRWGDRVFYTQSVNAGWDGKVNGQITDSAVYIWVAEGIDEKGNKVFRKGTVTLIR